MSVDVTLWSSDAWSSAADIDLLAKARAGSSEAYGELWRRHLPAAYAVASRYRGRSSAEDIVAEASARVLALVQAGKGPEEHFRSYFLSAVKTVAVDNARRDLRVVPAESDDLESLTDPVIEDYPGEGIDADLVREAFAGLSERDQRVLWHTTVEGEAPRTLAPVLGMSANAVSARAMRARESLRAHYLDAHASRGAAAADSDECRWTIDHLGAHVRGRLPKRQDERVRKHLAQCSHATMVAAELTEINSGFRALLVPLVLLAGVSTPGFVSGGTLLGLGSGALAGGSVGGSTPPVRPDGSAGAGASGQVVVVGQQVTAVASSVAAALVVGASLVAALPGVEQGPGRPATAGVATGGSGMPGAQGLPTGSAPGADPTAGGATSGATPGGAGGSGGAAPGQVPGSIAGQGAGAGAGGLVGGLLPWDRLGVGNGSGGSGGGNGFGGSGGSNGSGSGNGGVGPVVPPTSTTGPSVSTSPPISPTQPTTSTSPPETTQTLTSTQTGTPSPSDTGTPGTSDTGTPTETETITIPPTQTSTSTPPVTTSPPTSTETITIPPTQTSTSTPPV
ncbi:MAG: sigma-70 family RNA polymerase sigma factor, partial [Intrasporangium sp.]|uniref:sigma-70 family RNA polymerase sigma factor n=1 Tax=Intrasporangium sp. TaxID=1925024 RepID=UPI002647D913